VEALLGENIQGRLEDLLAVGDLAPFSAAELRRTRGVSALSVIYSMNSYPLYESRSESQIVVSILNINSFLATIRRSALQSHCRPFRDRS